MITIIRKHYHGDFCLGLNRLGRTNIKCARIEDGEELEGVLMQDFFGAHHQLL